MGYFTLRISNRDREADGAVLFGILPPLVMLPAPAIGIADDRSARKAVSHSFRPRIRPTGGQAQLQGLWPGPEASRRWRRRGAGHLGRSAARRFRLKGRQPRHGHA